MVAGAYCNRLYALHADKWRGEKREKVKGLEFKAFFLNQKMSFETRSV